MTWEFAKCPDTGAMSYEFKSGSNPFWTALWVRNPRVPITTVEVQGEGESVFVTLARETDGSLVDATGFGSGSFTLRTTSMDGQVVTETLSSFSEGALVAGDAQFE
jgi:expansin (peptidoglycan-binding protein)